MIRVSKRLAIGGGAALFLALVSVPAGAACTVDTEAVLFGQYDTFDPAPTDGIGAVHVTCDAESNFQVGLGAGGGSVQARVMTSGAYSLSYNLYSDASHVTLWGEGELRAETAVAGSGTSVDLTVYGRIPALQNLPAGQYSDVVTVTVTF